jgi:hypothetical protein
MVGRFGVVVCGEKIHSGYGDPGSVGRRYTIAVWRNPKKPRKPEVAGGEA